jgi:hypothetical protein
MRVWVKNRGGYPYPDIPRIRPVYDSGFGKDNPDVLLSEEIEQLGRNAYFCLWSSMSAESPASDSQ